MIQPIKIGAVYTGRIAVYLTKQEAIDMANTYGPSDGFYKDLMDAVAQAYPEVEDA